MATRTTRGFKRARSPEHKAQRRNDLIDAAATLLDEGGFDAVTLSAIARRANIAKSNVYTYFESREEILLRVLHADWRAYLDDIERALVPFAGTNDAKGVAAIMTGGYLARPRLCGLASVVASVLEQNVSEECVANFKRDTLGLGLRSAYALQATLPKLDFQQCVWLLRPMFALIAGFWPMANPPENVAKVLARPEFAMHCTDGPVDLARAFESLLLGELARHGD